MRLIYGQTILKEHLFYSRTEFFADLGTVHYLSVKGWPAGIQSQHQNFDRPPPPLKGHKNTMTSPPLDTVSYFA